MLRSHQSTKRVLITGFGPFPGQPKNPSADLVQALAKEYSNPNINLHVVILKTEYGSSLETLQRELKRFKPDIVISFGVAATRKTINLETVAYNRMKISCRADAAGFTPTKPYIDAGPKTLKSKLPVQAIRKDLAAAGIPARISHSAGWYVCNFIFYHALRHAARYNPKCITGFVHIPIPGPASGITKRDLVCAARIIIDTACSDKI
jgi:pyroglutamyl-peptidase